VDGNNGIEPEDALSPELEAQLNVCSSEAPRQAFVDDLRAGFTSGEFECAGDPGARGEFRDGLRDQFCEGDAAPRSAGRRLALVFGVAAGIAAVVFGVVVGANKLSQPRGASSWSIASAASNVSEIQVDGAYGKDVIELESMLASAQSITTGDTTVRLKYADLFVLELGEESTIDLTQLPVDGEGSYILTGEKGSLRLATGPGFPGHELIFRAPDLEAGIIGTIFGVDIFPYGTCLCCTEGLIGVRARTGTSNSVRVADDQRDFVDRTGGHDVGVVMDAHAGPLRELAGFWE